MTKKELLNRLVPFEDCQEVYIRMHSDLYPNGAQVIIQDVQPTKPWHGDVELIGLVCHDCNRFLTK